MKALHFNQHGDIGKLIWGEIPDPVLGPDEVLVRVRACAINHLDLWVLRGWPGLKLEMPHVGGADIAGEVADVGKGASGFVLGSRVVVNPGYATVEDEWTKRGEDSVSPSYRIIGEGCRGGFAEYVKVPAKNIFPLPNNISFTDAAAPLLVGVSACRMLMVRGHLRAGETVLIVGAGGGVNSFSIQLAKLLGAEVYALTSSPEKMEKARALGADHVLNYKQDNEWAKTILRLTKGRGVDLVVDNVGAATFNNSLRAVRRGGRIVTVGNTSGYEVTFDNRLVFTKQVSIFGSTMGSAQDFKRVTDLLWTGKLKPVVDEIIPLQDGRDAYRMLEEGRQFGKVVLTP